MTIITDERCTGYSSTGHPERPARVARTLAKLREQKELALKWAAPVEVTESIIERAHTKEHIAHVKSAVDSGAFRSMAEGLLVEAHESDLSVASEVTHARVTEALKVGAETYEGELDMAYVSRLSPTK